MGLVIVILGGIAVSSVTRVFILQKIRSIAVLKCLGARSDQIMWVYVLQVLALGLAGSVLGVALARVVLAAIPVALGGSTSILAEADYGRESVAGIPSHRENETRKIPQSRGKSSGLTNERGVLLENPHVCPHQSR